MVLVAIVALLALRDDDGSVVEATETPTAGTASDDGDADQPDPDDLPDPDPDTDPDTAPTAVPIDPDPGTDPDPTPIQVRQCGIEVYSVILPLDWYSGDSCAKFSRRPVTADAELTEVDLAWTFDENFEQAVARVGSTSGTWIIADDAPRIINGRRAHWFDVELGPDSPRHGRQELIVLEMTDGTIFLAASSDAPDGLPPIDYAANVDAMEVIAATMEIHDFVDCEMTSPDVAVATPPFALDLDNDGTSEFVGATELVGNGASISVWRWSCEEEFVSMLDWLEQGSAASPSYWRCRANTDGTVDLVLLDGFIDRDDESGRTYTMFASVHRKVGDEMVEIESYEAVGVEVTTPDDIAGFPPTQLCEDVSPFR